MRGVPLPAQGCHVQGGAMGLVPALFTRIFEAATRPASGDTFHGFGPGTNPTDRVGGFNVASSNCTGSGDGRFRPHSAQQSHKEPGNSGIASSGGTDNLGFKTWCPEFTVGPGAKTGR